MRSHLTAFGVGAGLSLLAAGAFLLFAPKIAAIDDEDGDGVHIVNIGKGDSGSFHLKDDAINLSADWKGDFEFAADGRSLTALKGSLEVTSKDDGEETRAVFKNDDGAVAVKYFKDDDLITNADAQSKAADLLQRFARSSGVNAGSRVKALITSGGKEAAIAEISQLLGSHAVGSYVEALAEQASLDDAAVMTLIEQVDELDSDYAKRSALSALLASPDLGDTPIEAIIAAASSIEGDHELRLIVEEIAGRKLSARNFSVATRLIDEIEGDHEVRLAVEALLESETIAPEDAAKAIDVAAKAIDGDYEIRLVIEAAGDKLNEPAIAAAALRALGAIEGGHEQRLAIEEIAGVLEEDSKHWLSLIEAVKTVNGDHEKRLTIEALDDEAPDRDDLHAALRKAAESIGSDHERRLAFETLE